CRSIVLCKPKRTPNVERGPGAEIECRQQPVSTCSSIARPFNLSLSASPFTPGSAEAHPYFVYVAYRPNYIPTLT
ncbi:unnamed protein product, partial [Trichogramma brassicae]